MGTWSYSAGNWLMLGSAVRTALMAPTSESAAADVTIGCSNPAHNVKAIRLGSGDGRWCFEVGIEGTKWVIRTVTAGVAGSSVTNAATDTPAGVACEVNHLIPAGNAPFSFRVRLVNNTLSLYVNGSDTATLSHALTAGEIAAYGRNRHWGFASNVSAAKVTLPRICVLEADITPRLDALAGVCGGNLYVVVDETGPRLVAAGVFNTAGPVSLAAYQQHVYGVDGAHARNLDIATLTVEDWGEATGDGILPGATETSTPGTYIPGTTRMTIVYNAGDSVGLAGDPRDPQNAFECAIGNPLDWNTAKRDEPGRAIALSNELPGRIGEPIVAVKELNANSLLYCCQNSIWRRIGSFSTGVPLLERVESAFGASGKDAIFAVSAGSVLIHSSQGVVAVGLAGPADTMSTPWLTDGITIAAEDAPSYTVQMLRDPRRNLVYAYLTPTATPEADFCIYFTLCERTQRTSGCGWFAMTLPTMAGPTACCLWKGKPVLGTRDGYLWTPDDDATSDNGTAIDCNIPILLTPEGRGGRPNPDQETVLTRFAFEEAVATDQTEASGSITYTVYGGLTSEMAYAGTARWVLLSEATAPSDMQPVMRPVRAPVIVLEMGNGADPDVTVRLEMLWAEVGMGARLQRRTRQTVTPGTQTRSPSGDLSHPNETPAPTPTPGPGPAPTGSPPSLPPVVGGYGIWFQSPYDMADQNPELEQNYAGIVVLPGSNGPGGIGGGVDQNPDGGNPGSIPGILTPFGTVAVATI